MKCGVVFGASKIYYVEQAIVSAKSFKRQMPDIPICLFTDKKELCLVAEESNIFSKVIFQNALGLSEYRSMKFVAILNSPFEKSLFVDTDTYLLAPIYEVFELLDGNDVLMTIDPRDSNGLKLDNQIISGPAPYNGGFIVYNNTRKVISVFETWRREYELGYISYPKDQLSLFSTLFQSNLRIFVLPNLYNFRTPYPAVLNGNVKLIHGHHSLKEFIHLSRIINRSSKLRVYSKGKIHISKKPLKRRLKIYAKRVLIILNLIKPERNEKIYI